MFSNTHTGVSPDQFQLLMYATPPALPNHALPVASSTLVLISVRIAWPPAPNAAAPGSTVVTSTSKGAKSSATRRQISPMRAISPPLKREVSPSVL